MKRTFFHQLIILTVSEWYRFDEKYHNVQPAIISYGDNDRAVRTLFVKHPKARGEWCSFDVVIRSDRRGCFTNNAQQYTHYNMKLTNSQNFQMMP